MFAITGVTGQVGGVAAGLPRERHAPPRVVELEGPRRVSPAEVAATFARLPGKPVTAQAVPRETWEAQFRAQGMRNPLPRMLDGFNEGWIEFGSPAHTLKGAVPLETVLQGLIQRVLAAA